MPDLDRARASRRLWCSRNRKHAKAKVVARKRSLIDRLQKYRSDQGCADCGERHPAVLDFHHLQPLADSDPNTRVFNLVWRNGWGWDRVMRHISHECVVLCANYHRKLHWRETHADAG